MALLIYIKFCEALNQEAPQL